MPSSNTAPTFGQDFSNLLEILHGDPATGPISPMRYAQVMGIDLEILAMLAHVDPNTILEAPGTERLQRYLHDALDVLRAASDIAGSVDDAIIWFKNAQIATFQSQTPAELVSAYHTGSLISYLQSLQAGFSG